MAILQERIPATRGKLVPVPRRQEQIDGMAKVIFPGKFSQRIVEQIEVVPRIQERIVEYILNVLVAHVVKESIEVPAPELMEEVTEVVKLNSQKQMQNRTVKRTVDPTVPELVEVIQPPLQEQTVKVAKAIPQERVHRMTQRQVPAAQKVQRTDEFPQGQVTDKAMAIPVAQQRQMPMEQTVWKSAQNPQVQYMDVKVICPLQFNTWFPPFSVFRERAKYRRYNSSRKRWTIPRSCKGRPPPLRREMAKIRRFNTTGGRSSDHKKRKRKAEGRIKTLMSRILSGSVTWCCHHLNHASAVGALPPVTKRRKNSTRKAQDTSWSKWWMPAAHASRPRGLESCARKVGWTSSLCAEKGSSISRRTWQSDGWKEKTSSWRTRSGKPASKRPRGQDQSREVVKLTVDKQLVDKGFRFGKVQTGEVLFTHASIVQSRRRS